MFICCTVLLAVAKENVSRWGFGIMGMKSQKRPEAKELPAFFCGPDAV